MEAEPAVVARELSISLARAKELVALATFQSIRSIGPEFASDLMDMGFHILEDLSGHSGAQLLDTHEQFVGYTTDPCVEDQFRRVLHYAATRDNPLSWYHFTAECKAYREKYDDYPDTRPTVAWHEVLGA